MGVQCTVIASQSGVFINISVAFTLNLYCVSEKMNSSFNIITTVQNLVLRESTICRSSDNGKRSSDFWDGGSTAVRSVRTRNWELQMFQTNKLIIRVHLVNQCSGLQKFQILAKYSYFKAQQYPHSSLTYWRKRLIWFLHPQQLKEPTSRPQREANLLAASEMQNTELMNTMVSHRLTPRIFRPHHHSQASSHSQIRYSET